MEHIPWNKLKLSRDASSLRTAWQKRDVPYVKHGNALQTLDICIPDEKFKDGQPLPIGANFWIVYIHGGAWRDPSVTASSFETTQTQLLTEKPYASMIKHVAGLASISYTLSSSPANPSNPSHPEDPSRNAKHPDHILDVLQAIHFLQHHFKFGNRFILVGHSCGATLAFQTVMDGILKSNRPSEESIVPPLAIAGLAGLYNLVELVKPSGEKHDKYLDLYKQFIVNAFGDDESIWKTASPTSNSYAKSWDSAISAILAHSPEDTLVPMRQYELMQKCLGELGSRLHTMSLTGDHNEMWYEGHELAKVIAYAIETVKK